MLFAVGDSGSAARLQASLQDSDATQKQYWTIARCLPGALPGEEVWTNDNPLSNLSKSKSTEPQQASTQFTKLLRLRCEEEWLEHDGDGEDKEGDFYPHEIAVLLTLQFHGDRNLLPCPPRSSPHLVGAALRTGRRHQIRRHLSNSKCPILADTSYGRGKYNRDARMRYGVSRLALHSRRIRFRDPSVLPGGEDAIVTVESPIPDDLRNVLARVPGFDMALHGELCDMGTAKTGI